MEKEEFKWWLVEQIEKKSCDTCRLNKNRCGFSTECKWYKKMHWKISNPFLNEIINKCKEIK